MDQVQKFLTKLFRQVETPLAAKALAYVERGEWSKIQDLRLEHPSTYKDHHEYFRDAIVCEIFRKSLLPGDAKGRKEAAIRLFWSSENQCKRTNIRLARYMPNTQSLRDGKDIAVVDFLNRWRKEVRSVLGKCSWLLDPRFSGGSTLSDMGLRTTIPDKMSSVPTCYAHALDLYHEAFARTPQGEKHPIACVVRGNRFFTVPKDSQKDRGCCVEASSAVSLQLAVGAAMKKRFKQAYRYRLESAPLRHQRLARVASAGRRELATIDLSNASDTVAYSLIQLVLPPDWFELLNSLRASHTLIGGAHVRLEKFSSMGNGFTFELETILFKTLCDTVIGSRVSYAYGDDLIVPMKDSKAILAALAFFGFTPNDKKTFCEGPFRESCGGDFFNGKPVRAHYIKEIPSEPQQWIALANGLKRMDPNLIYSHSAWRYCLDQIPKAIRDCRGPSWLGDIVIHDECQPTYRSYSTRVNGKRYEHSPTHFYRVYRPMARKFRLDLHFTYRVATAAASLGVPAEVSPRDSISGYKLDWVPAYGRVDGWGWIEIR